MDQNFLLSSRPLSALHTFRRRRPYGRAMAAVVPHAIRHVASRKVAHWQDVRLSFQLELVWSCTVLSRDGFRQQIRLRQSWKHAVTYARCHIHCVNEPTAKRILRVVPRRRDSYDSVPDELPPPWVPSAEFSQIEGMSEKVRYRIAFEARERVACTTAASVRLRVLPSVHLRIITPQRERIQMSMGSDPGLKAAVDGGQPAW